MARGATRLSDSAPPRRLFAALEVPGPIRARLYDACGPLRVRWPRLRWSPPDTWHVTIAFIGETSVAPERVTDVLASVVTAMPPVVRFRLGDAGRFGRRVLWVTVVDEPSGAVARLGGAAQAALDAAGIEVDRKDVQPHLTLARERRDVRVGPDVLAAVPAVEASWAVRELVVFRSYLGSHGRPTRHEPLARLALGDA